MVSCFKMLRRVGVASWAALLLSTPAAAQLKPEAPLGTLIPSRPQIFDQDRTDQVLAAFAACVVKKQRQLASEFVIDRTNLQFDKKYRSLADGNCLVDASGTYFAQAGLSMSGDAMRFAIADALLRAEIASIDPARLPKAQQLPLPLLVASDYEPKPDHEYGAAELKMLEERKQKNQASVILYKFGECAVRSSPQQAHALLAAAPKSDAEAAALQAILPSLGSCLERGSQIKLNRAVLRGSLAFSYYALAHAPLAPEPASAPAPH